MQRAGPSVALPAGQSASLRHIEPQNGSAGKSGEAIQSDSSAHWPPPVVQGAPNAAVPAGGVQTSWKPSLLASTGPTTQTRPALQRESAPEVGISFWGIAAWTFTWP